MEFNRIKVAIDQWDPVDLLSHAPKDEYDQEIRRIIELSSDANTVESLGKIIYEVFSESFGNVSFDYDLDECKHVASEILNI